MGRGANIPWVGGSNYHEYGDQNTMDMGFDIPWIGGSIYHG
jgi:hypothetical protein